MLTDAANDAHRIVTENSQSYIIKFFHSITCCNKKWKSYSMMKYLQEYCNIKIVYTGVFNVFEINCKQPFSFIC